MKQIVKEIEGLTLSYVKAPGIPTPNEWQTGDYYPAWRNLSNVDWYLEDELDVAGWTKDDLTMFLRAAEVQQNGFHFCDTLNNLADPANPQSEIRREYIIEWFALTSYPIDMISYYDRLVELANAKGSLGLAPNFAEQITSFDNVIVGALRYYTIDSTLATTTTSPLLLTQTHNFGSGSASASDKLYLYRFVQTTTPNDSPVVDSGNAFCQVPSLRFVLNADLNKEAEYQYIMRLKRSLDLYQEGL